MGAEDLHGSCVVCNQNANLRCSDCKLEFYCTRGHQKADWTRHKPSCRVWEIKESPDLGRYLVATRDLNVGDTVITEHPLVWGPALHSDERICVGCGDQKVVTRCPRCSWPACSVNCAGLVDADRHGIECELLAKARILPRCDVLLPLRILLLRQRNPKRWALLEALQSHAESRGPGTEAYDEVQSIAEHIGPLLTSYPASRDILLQACGLIDVNALETNPPVGSVALYKITCLLEHRCISNTRHSFAIDAKGRPCITVKVVTTVKKGEHLSTTYTHALWATRARREHLLLTKYFECRCDRCADPTELGTHLGTLTCHCGPGLVLPKDPLDPETDWACNNCSGILSSADVMGLTERLGEEVEGAMAVASRDCLEDLLSRLKVLLHPGHQYCIAVSHSLAQLLPPDDPRKAEICKHIIRTTEVLDPHGTRLALYTAVAMRELASCPGENRRALLERAVILLKPEPPNCPGRKMLQLLEQELYQWE